MTEMKQGVAAVEYRDCTDGPTTCRKNHPDRCVTPSGKETTPHVDRWKAGGHYADGYNSREAEVAALIADRDDLRATVRNLTTENTGLNEQVAKLTKDLAAAVSEFDAYKKAHPDTPATPAGFKTLLFEDDFTAGKITAAPLLAGVKDKFAMNGRDDVSMAANWSVVDDVLVNTMRQQKALASNGQTRSVTTAMIQTRDKVTIPNEFFVQFRAKVGWTPGFWPGLVWFTNLATPGGEVDPFECFPKVGRPKITLHSRPYGSGHILEPFTPPASTKHPVDDWYVVEVEKTADHWSIWYDGVLVKTYDKTSKAWDDAYHANPKATWNLWVNTQSGGQGGSATAETDWSKAVAQLDYLRVWVR